MQNWPLRISLTLFLFSIPFLLGSCRDPMEHSRCDDTVIKRVPSPDSKLVIVIYNRSCSGGTGLYTYAKVEDPSVWFSWPRQPDVCFLVTLAGGYHQLDAVWKDAKHIEVSSTDELDPQYGISSQHETCNDLDVAYNFHYKPLPIQEAPDAETVAAILEVIKQSEECLKERSAPSHVDYLRSLVDHKQHRYALELLCGNLEVEKCPISQETFALIERAGKTMGVANRDLESLKPLVQP
jgi:hypothetical protein